MSMVVIDRINAVWALDFMHDALYGRRTFRTLNVIDEADRGALGIDLALSIPASRVLRFLEQLIEIHGKPWAIRCDNGPELTSQAFTEWCRAMRSRFASFNPASPTRMPSSSASTVATAKRCSTPTCSRPSPMSRRPPTIGSSATTKSGRTMRWEACRQRVTARSFSRRKCPL